MFISCVLFGFLVMGGGLGATSLYGYSFMALIKDKMFDEAFELKNANKIDEAIEAFKKITIEFGDDKIATNMLAGLYYAEKDDAKSALPYAIKGVKLLPKSELASLCLFHCFHDLGKAEEAETEIKRYISLGGKIKDYKVLFDENNLSAEDFK